MSPIALLPDLPGFCMEQINRTENQIVITARATSPTACCPDWKPPSSRVHSYYTRSPMDLPSSGRPVSLVLGVRHFRCANAACPRKTFAEPLPNLLLPHAQRTSRLRESLRALGEVVGGEGGAQVSKRLGMACSADTVLRLVRHAALPASPAVKVLGVDEWAWRKGQSYGSILVNLETHKIIGLLADREAESVRQWLATHPEVDVVSRDRGGTYIDGATWGAPQATQVADRWHILANLGDAVEEFLIRAGIRLKDGKASSGECQNPDKPLSSFSATPASQRKSQARLLRKWKLYQRVQELHTAGMSLRKIGEELGLARNTVRKYVRQAPDPPLPTPRPLRASRLDRYEDYLLERWSQGERNAAQLYREIRERGYPGSVTMVRAYVAHLRTTTADGSPPRSRKERAAAVSPRALRWLLTRKREDLDREEQIRLEQLLNLSSDVQAVYSLLQTFLKMVRERKHQELPSWMQQAVKSGIPELLSFVAGIERDYDAVHAALRLPWSQDVTEGKVNKLKTLKRVMYGRAGFALLRQRLLHDA